MAVSNATPIIPSASSDWCLRVISDNDLPIRFYRLPSSCASTVNRSIACASIPPRHLLSARVQSVVFSFPARHITKRRDFSYYDKQVLYSLI
jgi:hypothetical protein